MFDNLFARMNGEMATNGHRPDGPKQQAADKKCKKTETHAPPKKKKSWYDVFRPLVGDKLYYRIGSASNWQPSGAPANLPSPSGLADSSKLKATEKEFVRAFQDVWNRLSALDQLCFFDYWFGPKIPLLAADYNTPLQARPQIQIVAAAWTPTYETVKKVGFELNFPIGLITDHADRLRYEIARTLAMAYRYASGAHWSLVVSKFTKPLVEWEQSRGKTSAAQYERKEIALERGYMKAYEAAVTQQLRDWGIEVPPCVATPTPTPAKVK